MNNFIKNLIKNIQNPLEYKDDPSVHLHTELLKQLHPREQRLLMAGLELEETMPTGRGYGICVNFGFRHTIANDTDMNSFGSFTDEIYGEIAENIAYDRNGTKIDRCHIGNINIPPKVLIQATYGFPLPSIGNPVFDSLEGAITYIKGHLESMKKHGIVNPPVVTICFGEIVASYSDVKPVKYKTRYNSIRRDLIIHDFIGDLKEAAKRKNEGILVMDKFTHEVLRNHVPLCREATLASWNDQEIVILEEYMTPDEKFYWCFFDGTKPNCSMKSEEILKR